MRPTSFLDEEMSYIQELRALIGSRPIILVGTGVLLLKDSRVLLQRRKDNRLWGIPGGSLEPGESLEETARREVLEEVGLKVSQLHLFQVYSGQGQFYQYPNGDQIYDVCIAYWSRDFQGELHADAEEVIELKFFDIHHLPDDINPLDRPILQDLLHASWL